MVDQSANWLLDSNVISELIKQQPNTNVIEYVTRYKLEICTAAPVLHELRYAWLRMPDGQRKDQIGQFIQQVVSNLKIVAYDEAAVRIHATIRREAEQAGNPLPFVDGQIASIAIANGLTLVTRNTKDFERIKGLRFENWFYS